MCTTFSQTFDKTGKSEIGLLLFANSWFSVLGRDATSANFQVVGNMHDRSVDDRRFFMEETAVRGSPVKHELRYCRSLGLWLIK